MEEINFISTKKNAELLQYICREMKLLQLLVHVFMNKEPILSLTHKIPGELYIRQNTGKAYMKSALYTKYKIVICPRTKNSVTKE
jgi:hypothetical protein